MTRNGCSRSRRRSSPALAIGRSTTDDGENNTPPTPVTIELRVPLGDRRVVDGLELGVEISDYAE
ncbi:MAG: hypothetical protein WKF45_06370 [Ilumatobacteraceae bacterium]